MLLSACAGLGSVHRTSRFFWRSAALLSVAFWEAFCFFRIVSGTAMSFWVGTLCLLAFFGVFVNGFSERTMSGPLCWWLVGLSLSRKLEQKSEVGSREGKIAGAAGPLGCGDWSTSEARTAGANELAPPMASRRCSQPSQLELFRARRLRARQLATAKGFRHQLHAEHPLSQQWQEAVVV